MRMSIGRRLARAAATVAALAAGAAVVVAAPAHAYTPVTWSDCGNEDKDQPSVRFDDGSDVQIVLHYGESRLDAFDNVLLIDAVGDIANEFNKMGGTSAHVRVSITTEPFKWGRDSHGNRTYYSGDTDPSIHIGFVHDLDVDVDDAAGATYAPIGTVGKCHYKTASIAMLDTDALYALADEPGQTPRHWSFAEPTRYYQEGLFGAGVTYFRQSILHELLHAFGLAHSANTYSYLNYGERPWANRPVGQRARPLPDDVRGMRHLYPASGSRFDVALLNTWFTESSDPKVPANQSMFCKPGRGKNLGPSMFGAYCGAADDPLPTTVCGGQSLAVQFALANYSTSAVNSSVWLYFSTDDVWSPGDIASSDYVMVNQTDAQSSRRGFTYKVPDLPSGYYYPILRALAVDQSTSVTDDWMPLTGMVTGGPCA